MATFTGTPGNDAFSGTTGPDTMSGGPGDDSYIVENPADIVIEAAGEGWDAVHSTISYTLASDTHVEGLATTNPSGTAAINLTGNGLANYIVGNAGANSLDGGAGNDVLEGLGGNDGYIVDSIFDRAIELAGGGWDAVYASISYTLASDTEVEGLATVNAAGTAAINLTGNGLANYIVGNAGANVIDGLGGADTLEGAGGNDVYFIDNASDTIIETSGNGTFDVAYTTVSYTLGANDVEALATPDPSSTAGINLVGNAIGNYIVGNAGANILDGKGGADTLEGGAGVDFYAFSSALGPGNNDTIVGFASGTDKIVLDDAVFGVLTPGSLPAGAFRTGASAQDADDRIIYDPATGNLF